MNMVIQLLIYSSDCVCVGVCTNEVHADTTASSNALTLNSRRCTHEGGTRRVCKE